jgi:hypothetical protein
VAELRAETGFWPVRWVQFATAALLAKTGLARWQLMDAETFTSPRSARI